MLLPSTAAVGGGQRRTAHLVIEPDVHEESVHVGSEEGRAHQVGQTWHV